MSCTFFFLTPPWFWFITTYKIKKKHLNTVHVLYISISSFKCILHISSLPFALWNVLWLCGYIWLNVRFNRLERSSKCGWVVYLGNLPCSGCCRWVLVFSPVLGLPLGLDSTLLLNVGTLVEPCLEYFTQFKTLAELWLEYFTQCWNSHWSFFSKAYSK